MHLIFFSASFANRVLVDVAMYFASDVNHVYIYIILYTQDSLREPHNDHVDIKLFTIIM